MNTDQKTRRIEILIAKFKQLPSEAQQQIEEDIEKMLEGSGKKAYAPSSDDGQQPA